MNFKCHSTTGIVALSNWKVTFSVGQEAENDFKVTLDNLNHRYFKIIQIAFSAIPETEIKLKSHASSWNIFLSTSPSRNLGWSRGRKWVQSVTRPLETSLSRLHHSRILGIFKIQKMTFKCHSTIWIVALSTWKSHIFSWSRSRKWLQTDIRQFESSICRLHPNRWDHGSRPQPGTQHKILPGAHTLNMTSTVWNVEIPTHRRTWNVSNCDPSIKLGSG